MSDPDSHERPSAIRIHPSRWQADRISVLGKDQQGYKNNAVAGVSDEVQT